MFAISGTPLRPLNAPSLQVAVERRLGFCQPSPVGASRRLDFDSSSGCPKPPSKPGEYIKALVSAAATFDDAQMRSFEILPPSRCDFSRFGKVVPGSE